MDSFRAMQVFVRVAQEASLSAAARQLGSSPASVSRQIQALEDGLGARLLNRSSRKLTLTEAGQAYLQHAVQILQHMDEAQQSILQLQRSASGTLRVHSRVLVGELYIVPALTRFLLQHPEIKIDLMMSNHAVDLIEQNIDIDIRIGKLSDSLLIAKKLAISERVVCASPAYLKRNPAIATPHDLLQHNCLTYRLNMGHTHWRFLDQDGLTTDVPVSGSLQSDSGPALRAATLDGLGISLMPDWSVQEEIRRGSLLRLFPQYQVSFMEFDNGVYAMYQRSRHMSAKVRLFIDYLSQVFQQLAAGGLPAATKY